jgi:hypothetical protein
VVIRGPIGVSDIRRQRGRSSGERKSRLTKSRRHQIHPSAEDVSQDPRISGIQASKSGMEESSTSQLVKSLKRSGSSICGGHVAVIRELREFRYQEFEGPGISVVGVASPETPRVSGPSNRRTRGGDRGIEVLIYKIFDSIVYLTY